jgi:hypothetical protein
LISCFPEEADFYAAVEVDPDFGLGIKGAETRAGQVFAEGLLIFAKVNMIFLYTCG